ncbi:hypothetical protein ACVIHI_003864 [Bradyrhizobium sp. USDA 4524]|nr:hypothetical protein [Bradyrhizobium sp. USDA 4538]MCP1903783.1 hypothetical protein [Bradyrhizobium sp. USDA 4537]MCP1990561.1 hypothetical protein [Bradyrhizobium sp. USDA 4539]
MKFETGMENNTSDMCDGGECESCPTDPNVLIEFKHAIHALGGKWKLEILFTLMNGGVRFGALRRALAPITQHADCAAARARARRPGGAQGARREAAAGRIRADGFGLEPDAGFPRIAGMVEDVRPAPQ